MRVKVILIRRINNERFISINEEDIKEAWNDCLFVFDANVLLHLYRFPRQLREDFLKILKDHSFKERIWLPFQAGIST